jgi:hypothetical protein
MPILKNATDIVKKAFGANASSYLNRTSSNAELRASIIARSGAFSTKGKAIQTQLSAQPIIDLGGRWMNEVTYLASINITQSPALQKHVGNSLNDEITEANSNAWFTSLRFLDGDASRKNNRPVVGHVDFIFIVHIEPDNNSYKVHQIDAAESKTIYESKSPPVLPSGKSAESILQKIIVNREARVDSPLNHLVGYEKGKKQVFLAIKERTKVKGRATYTGLPGVELLSLHPSKTFVPKDKPFYYSGLPGPELLGSGPERAFRLKDKPHVVDVGDSVESQGASFPTSALTSGVVDIRGSGGDSGPTYGDPTWTQGPYFNCSGFNSRDECKNCCITSEALAIGGVLSAAVACHAASSVCIPCHIGCGLVEAASVALIIYLAGECHENCELKVYH